MATARKLLVIGAGWSGRRHVEAFQRTGRATLGVAEPDPSRRDALRRDFELAEVFATLDEALTRPWDGAIVATPANSHVAIGRELTERGLPVLVEKPLAVTLAGVGTWQAAAEARKVPVMVGFVYRCHPLLRVVREQLQAGRIGRPLQLIAQRGADLASRRPEYARTYYARREEGGGIVQDILSHVYNAAEWLIGPMDRLAADAAHLHVPDVEVEDTVHVIARHGSVLAAYCVNQHQPATEFTITVNGTRGALRAALHENTWALAERPGGDWQRNPGAPLDPIEWFARQASAFLDVIDSGQAPPCSLAEGVTTLHAVLATLRAVDARQGWVEVSSHVRSAPQSV